MDYNGRVSAPEARGGCGSYSTRFTPCTISLDRSPPRSNAFLRLQPIMTANPSRLQCVLDIRASLGEGPVWSTREQVLYWVDINAPSLNRFDPATGRNVAYPMPASIGCLALRQRGGF